MSDIKAQIDSLIFRGFVTETGWKRLPDVLRYLKAIERRLEKLPIDPNRDRLHMIKIESVSKDYQSLLNKLPKGKKCRKQLKRYAG